MRLLLLFVALTLSSIAAASCESTGSETDLADAAPDQSAPFCKTTADCTGGLECTFEIIVGCGAQGECRAVGPDAGTGACTPGVVACACDGRNVNIPPCWDNLAPVPVLPTGTPCTGDL